LYDSGVEEGRFSLMSNLIDQSRLDSLEVRLKRSERWLLLALVGWVVTACFGIVLLLKRLHDPPSVSDTVRVHRLIVLDNAGKERIVIASPLPDPVVNGKTIKRRTGVSAGVQFKDPDGTERGGIASEDDGSFMFGVDDERGNERAHLYYIPKRGPGVYLQGDNGRQVLSLLNPRGVITETGDNGRMRKTDHRLSISQMTRTYDLDKPGFP
jgi:hypothetical protein